MPRSCSRRRSSVRSTMASRTRHRPWRGWPSESKAPPLTSDSMVRLLRTTGSTRGAEVEDVGEGPVGVALGHDPLHQALAHVAHRGQAEDDGARAGAAVLADAAVRRELGHRAVHVGHQHVDAHGPALGQVHRRLVLVVLDRGQQRRHVLDRVVRLEPRRLVGHEAVAVGVGLVEGVVGERLDDVEELRAQLLAVALGRRSRRRTSRARRRSVARIFLPHALRRLSASSRSSRRTSGPPASPTPGRASARRCP